MVDDKKLHDEEKFLIFKYQYTKASWHHSQFALSCRVMEQKVINSRLNFGSDRYAAPAELRHVLTGNTHGPYPSRSHHFQCFMETSILCQIISSLEGRHLV